MAEPTISIEEKDVTDLERCFYGSPFHETSSSEIKR
jgi:hypothetical protein